MSHSLIHLFVCFIHLFLFSHKLTNIIVAVDSVTVRWLIDWISCLLFIQLFLFIHLFACSFCSVVLFLQSHVSSKNCSRGLFFYYSLIHSLIQLFLCSFCSVLLFVQSQVTSKNYCGSYTLPWLNALHILYTCRNRKNSMPVCYSKHNHSQSHI